MYIIKLLMVSFGPMISFGGVFMGMIMMNQLLVVVVIRISLNKIGRNYTLTIRNRGRRHFTFHISMVLSDMEYPKNKHKHRNEDDLTGGNTN